MVILAGWIASGLAQAGLALAALTVPEANLPDGCRLRPGGPPTTSVVRDGRTMLVSNPGTSYPFPSNPWSGTDRKLMATVRQMIDASQGKLLPGYWPTAARDAAESRMMWADKILEAYHAAYVSATDGHQVDVSAVTFSDVKLATTSESMSAMLNPPRGLSSRVVRGATVVRVAAPTTNQCSRAVLAYVESLK